jgi:hypothetical protein
MDFTTPFLEHCDEIVLARNTQLMQNVMLQHSMRHPHSCFPRKLCIDRKFFEENFHLSVQQELGSGQGPLEGSCEDGNKPPGSIKCWVILE